MHHRSKLVSCRPSYTTTWERYTECKPKRPDLMVLWGMLNAITDRAYIFYIFSGFLYDISGHYSWSMLVGGGLHILASLFLVPDVCCKNRMAVINNINVWCQHHKHMSLEVQATITSWVLRQMLSWFPGTQFTRDRHPRTTWRRLIRYCRNKKMKWQFPPHWFGKFSCIDS